jgi:glycosyltransferase involved in cell wall biosynthesis
MNDNPLVSIVIPSFNQGEYIEQTILSILNQSYKFIEIIVIDGGSKDRTLSILKKYDDKIKYWKSEPDKGQPNAINKGFEKASGKILTFLNSDDLLLPESVRYVVDTWEKKGGDIFYGNYIFIDKDGNKREIFKVSPYVRLIWQIITPPISQPGTFFTRKIFDQVGGLDEELQYAFDLDFFVKVLYSDTKYVRINKYLSAFRKHDEQKGRLGEWARVNNKNREIIDSRYLYVRTKDANKSFALMAHKLIQLFNGNSIVTLAYRIFKQRRIRKFQ